jgi:hypothetical protein
LRLSLCSLVEQQLSPYFVPTLHQREKTLLFHWLGDPDWIRTSDPQLRRHVRLFGVSETVKELKALPWGQCVTKCVTLSHAPNSCAKAYDQKLRGTRARCGVPLQLTLRRVRLVPVDPPGRADGCGRLVIFGAALLALMRMRFRFVGLPLRACERLVRC